MDKARALRQLKAIEKLARKIRLAADGWDVPWKTLVATLMSARTTDKITIPIAQKLFEEYNSIEKLSKASIDDIGIIIRGVNFYKTKARNVSNLAKIITEKHGGSVPMKFEELIELPGVGRKTANVFLAEYGHGRIGVDTHVGWVSRQMGWTKHENQEKVEKDLEELFPRKYWGKLNWILVRFGQSYPSRNEKLKLLEEIKKIK